MRLILIRHGESEANVRRAFAGASCTGLSELGVAQTQALVNRLRSSGEIDDFNALVSSPITRAKQTAATLLDVLPVDAVEEWEDLCEQRPGEADGLRWVDYDARFGSFDMLMHQDRPIAPGGESWAGFCERVQTCMDGLAKRFNGQSVVAVTHGGFVVASILSLFAIPRPGTGTRLHADPTSITEWHYANGAWSLARFNDAGHLSDVNR